MTGSDGARCWLVQLFQLPLSQRWNRYNKLLFQPHLANHRSWSCFLYIVQITPHPGHFHLMLEGLINALWHLRKIHAEMGPMAEVMRWHGQWPCQNKQTVIRRCVTKHRSCFRKIEYVSWIHWHCGLNIHMLTVVKLYIAMIIFQLYYIYYIVNATNRCISQKPFETIKNIIRCTR